MIMNKKYNYSPNVDQLDISVQINQPVFDRINKTLQNSNIEEGGKLLGNIALDGNNLLINVETFIDSGPQMDSSTGHLHPDGIYQEAMFRLVERYDNEIEHIGSWHSHHCNGLCELSQGDINGYYSSVNDKHYNLGAFIAILITKFSLSRTSFKTFLFVRDLREYIAIEETAIKVVPGAYKYDELLLTGEELSLKYRKRYISPATDFAFQQSIKKEDNTLNRIRVEDNNWLKENCGFVSSKRDKRDGTIFWEWKDIHKGTDLLFRYKHPIKISRFFNNAELKALYLDKVILTEKVSLNNHRHNKILDFIDNAKHKLKNYTEDL
jgi:hypothetical protein